MFFLLRWCGGLLMLYRTCQNKSFHKLRAPPRDLGGKLQLQKTQCEVT